MNSIEICKYYKHPKTCTCNNFCCQQLVSNRKHCRSDLYYSMGLEQEFERLIRDYFKQNKWLQESAKERKEYKQALDEIEKIAKQTCIQRCTNDCLGTRKHCGYGHILSIINKAKDGNNENNR